MLYEEKVILLKEILKAEEKMAPGHTCKPLRKKLLEAMEDDREIIDGIVVLRCYGKYPRVSIKPNYPGSKNFEVYKTRYLTDK